MLVLGLPALAPAAPPPIEDDFKYFSPDSDLLVVVHMDKAVASDPVRRITKDIPDAARGLEEMKKDIGVGLADIERLSLGVRAKEDNALLVVRTNKPVKAADVLATFRQKRFPSDKEHAYKEVKVGERTMYEADQPDQPSFCLIGDRTLLVAEVKVLKPALERGGKGEVPAGMRKGLAQVDQQATLYFVLDLKHIVADKPNALPGAEDFLGGFNARKSLADTETLTGSLTLAETITGRMTALCKDEKAAAALKADVDKGLAGIAEEFKKLADKDPRFPKQLLLLPGLVKTSTAGNAVRGEVSVKSDAVVTTIKAIFAPANPPPPPGKEAARPNP
jgi:hypothetical protein